MTKGETRDGRQRVTTGTAKHECPLLCGAYFYTLRNLRKHLAYEHPEYLEKLLKQQANKLELQQKKEIHHGITIHEQLIQGATKYYRGDADWRNFSAEKVEAVTA